MGTLLNVDVWENHAQHLHELLGSFHAAQSTAGQSARLQCSGKDKARTVCYLLQPRKDRLKDKAKANAG
jgi:hypothetical protein